MNSLFLLLACAAQPSDHSEPAPHRPGPEGGNASESSPDAAGREEPPPSPPNSSSEARPKVSGAVEFECGKGSPEDYEAVYPPNIIDVGGQWYIEELGGVLTRFETVMFDKYSLALFTRIFEQTDGLAGVRTVYDPGTGTGALALAALAHGAERAIGTELDPLARQNALYNARALGMADRMEVRLVGMEDQGAYAVLAEGETFDLLLADPPQGYDMWQARPYPDVQSAELQDTKEVFFTADPGGCFLESMIDGLDAHLAPGGRALIAMKVDHGKKMLKQLARKNGFQVRVAFDTRKDLDNSRTRRIGDVNKDPDLSQNAQVFELRRQAE